MRFTTGQAALAAVVCLGVLAGCDDELGAMGRAAAPGAADPLPALTGDNALETRIASHPAFFAARATVMSAAAGILEAQAATKPQIGAGIDVGWTADRLSAPVSSGTPVALATVNLEQLLRDGGQVQADTDRATAELLQAKLQLALTGDDLLAQLLTAWNSQNAAQRSMRVIDRQLADYNRRKPQIDAAAARGVMTNSELIELAAVVNQITTRRVEAKLRAEEARADIDAVLGPDNGAALRVLASAMAQTGGRDPAGAPNYRKLASQAGVERLAALQSGQEAAQRPSAKLQAQVGAPLWAPARVGASVGVNISWNAFDGGASAARAEALAAERAAAEYSIAGLGRSIAAREQSWEALKASAARRQALLSERLSLSRRRVDELERLLIAGQSDVGSIAQEILAGAEAELGLIALDAELRTAQLTAFAARGGVCALVEACDLFDEVAGI